MIESAVMFRSLSGFSETNRRAVLLAPSGKADHGVHRRIGGHISIIRRRVPSIAGNDVSWSP